VLASPGVCKKRLLKAELCFVALMFGCLIVKIILMWDCSAFVLQYILVMEYVKFDLVLNDMYFSCNGIFIFTIRGESPSR